MADKTIVGGVDTWVGDGSATVRNSNHNGDNFVLVQKSSGNDAYALLFVRAPGPVQAGTTVLTAELDVKVKSSNVGTATLKATPLGGDWKAGQVTWNNQPGVKSSGLGALPAYASLSGGIAKGDVFTFSVAPHLQAAADGDDWYGWRIESDTAGVVLALFSSEAVAEGRRPRLRITWSNAPAAPTDLSPSGAQFVSVAKPVLRYTFLDFGGNTELVGHQIQVDPTDPEGTTFDTGEIPTSTPEYDLSTSAYAGLANGAAARWRVRTQDGAGLWSPWSDWANFERLNKGSLVIDNPAVAPNDFVTETTPPFAWTHSGTWSQEAWQVILQQQGLGSWSDIYDTDKRSGNDSAWTPPKGVLTKANWSTPPGLGDEWTVPTKYRVVVRTWDGQQRVRTPGDPVYYQAIREFTVKEGAATPVTNLAADRDRPWPWPKITWSRSTAPDEFAIVRDGEFVDQVEPSEVFVSGTEYEFVDKLAKPGREHTWAVLPVVNGQMAPLQAQWVTETVETQYVWLTTPSRSNAKTVMIHGAEGLPDIEPTMPDQGENLQILNGAKIVRITRGVRGYGESSLTGALIELPVGQLADISARDWAKRLMDIKSNPGQPLILMWMDEAVPITAYDITVRPSDIVGRLTVEFNWHQTSIPRYARDD